MYDSAVEIDFISYAAYILLPWFVGTQGIRVNQCLCVCVCTCASLNMPKAMDLSIAVYVCVFVCLGVRVPLDYCRKTRGLGRGLLINGINTGGLIHSLALCLRYTQVFTTVSDRHTYTHTLGKARTKGTDKSCGKNPYKVMKTEREGGMTEYLKVDKAEQRINTEVGRKKDWSIGSNTRQQWKNCKNGDESRQDRLGKLVRSRQFQVR